MHQYNSTGAGKRPASPPHAEHCTVDRSLAVGTSRDGGLSEVSGIGPSLAVHMHAATAKVLLGAASGEKSEPERGVGTMAQARGPYSCFPYTEVSHYVLTRVNGAKSQIIDRFQK